MGWFGLTEDSSEKKSNLDEAPKLPELPELPKLPELKEHHINQQRTRLPQLPSFKTGSAADKFSQNTIKEAVSGRERKVEYEDEDDIEETSKKLTRELDEDEDFEIKEDNFPKLPYAPKIKHIPYEFKEASRIVKRTEPVFVRLDKFEESLKIFQETKEKLSEIDQMLHDIQKIKEAEQKELEEWGTELQILKQQIEKVDNEVFSKIE